MPEPHAEPETAGGDDDAVRRVLQEALGEAYTLGRLLGSGGFARVYAARDTRLERDVAVKMLRPELASSGEPLARFQREARALAGVRHPNVIDIYTVGEAGGAAYFVMPLVEGQSLRDLLDRAGKLEVEEARRILTESCRGLEAAHRAGVIHRDVKPANILLEGEGRRVLLTDFGIARAVEEGDAGLTTRGTFVGTPRYMSPEQAAGDPVDPRSDLYSLGVVAYEMLAGRPPFQDQATHALVLDHIAGEPPELRTLRPDCSEALAGVVHRCLAKAPDDRWPDAGELGRALETGPGVELAPRLGRPGAPEEDAAPELRRFRRRAPAVALATLVLLGLDLAVLETAAVGGAALLVGIVVVSVLYGRVWTAGFGWREVLGLPPGERTPGERPPESSTAGTTGGDEAVFGPYTSRVREARGSRVVIVRAYRGMTRVEQERFPGLLPTVDTLYQSLKQTARNARVLEERLNEEESAVLRGEVEESRMRTLASLEEVENALTRLRDLVLLVAGGSVERAADLQTAIEEGRAAASPPSSASPQRPLRP